jgi:hypothetical protein
MTSSETRLGLMSSCGLLKSSSSIFRRRLRSFGLAEICLAVEVDVAENAFQLCLVGLFDGIQNNVDQLADIGGVAAFIQTVVIGQKTVFTLPVSWSFSSA